MRKTFETHVIQSGVLYSLNCQQDMAAHIKIVGGAGRTVTIKALTNDSLTGAMLLNAVVVPTYIHMALAAVTSPFGISSGDPAAGGVAAALYLPDYLEITPGGGSIVVTVVHIIDEP